MGGTWQTDRPIQWDPANLPPAAVGGTMEPVSAAAQPSALLTEQTEQALLAAAQTVAADVREQRNAADATAAGQSTDAIVPVNAIVPIPNSAALAAVVDV